MTDQERLLPSFRLGLLYTTIPDTLRDKIRITGVRKIVMTLHRAFYIEPCTVQSTLILALLEIFITIRENQGDTSVIDLSSM
jgi:hypothetical protein